MANFFHLLLSSYSLINFTKIAFIPLYSKHLIFLLFVLAFTMLLCGFIRAQDTIISKNDSVKTKNDTIKKSSPKESEYALSSKVEYTANDSIRFNIAEQKVYLFGKSEIKYEDINLTANYIEISFKKNQLYAKGVADSTGKTTGEPVFIQGSQSFSSATLTYNFKTKKGLITSIITKEGESYLHGNLVKKFSDNSINLREGMYTTCDLRHPHYEIKFFTARVIPDDKIVTGPCYLVVEDVPMPLALPFGYFPNKKGQKSGLLIPSYGESASRGFFLENGGYYVGLGEHFDLALRGDVYSHGSWAARALSNYNKRYKFNGNINFGYAINTEGDQGTPSYNKRNDFYIKWYHSQDAKARPNSRFSANVNAGSSKYNKYNPSSTTDYLTNTLQSNVSYSTTIAGKYNFSVNMSHSQNTLNRTVSLNLPEIAFSANRFYPFRSEKRVGKMRWYENISVGYAMNAENSINTIDSLLFREETLKQMQNGIKHSIPISNSIKVLKTFTWTNTISFTERWYLQSIEKHWINDMHIVNGDTMFGYFKTDTIQGFKAARDFNFSSSLSTRLYGMYQFKKGKIVALRHVLTPTVSFVYTPDFGSERWGYYRYLRDGDQSVQKKYYSIFETGIYGAPPRNKSGFINFSLANNLEMKVKSKKDTITGIKKVVLIDNFTISGGYDIAKDSLNWSKINMNGRTRLFKNLDVTYASSWDPYVVDSTGKNLNEFELKKNKRLFRRTNTNWAFSLNWSLRSKQKKKEITSSKATEEELNMIKANPDAYLDFDQPWSLNIQYQLNYMNSFDPRILGAKKMVNKVIQTLSFSGDVNLSSKWKVGFRSGYDFEQKDFSYTSVDIYRDLHCWEIVFNWIPMGFRKSYNITIRVKSPVLQDLKLTKKKDFRDY
ncbi:MAG: putative LPS assembly protein LptD [Bacteroidales bacterium]